VRVELNGAHGTFAAHGTDRLAVQPDTHASRIAEPQPHIPIRCRSLDLFGVQESGEDLFSVSP